MVTCFQTMNQDSWFEKVNCNLIISFNHLSGCGFCSRHLLHYCCCMAMIGLQCTKWRHSKLLFCLLFCEKSVATENERHTFWTRDTFYPRDAMLARVIAIATCPSVCLSVCLSRTGIVSKRRKLAA